MFSLIIRNSYKQELNSCINKFTALTKHHGFHSNQTNLQKAPSPFAFSTKKFNSKFKAFTPKNQLNLFFKTKKQIVFPFNNQRRLIFGFGSQNNDNNNNDENNNGNNGDKIDNSVPEKVESNKSNSEHKPSSSSNSTSSSSNSTSNSLVSKKSAEITEHSNKSAKSSLEAKKNFPNSVLRLVTKMPLIPGQTKVIVTSVSLDCTGGFVGIFMSKQSSNSYSATVLPTSPNSAFNQSNSKSSNPVSENGDKNVSDKSLSNQKQISVENGDSSLDSIHHIGVLAYLEKFRVANIQTDILPQIILVNAGRTIQLIKKCDDNPANVIISPYGDDDYTIRTKHQRAHLDNLLTNVRELVEKKSLKNLFDGVADHSDLQTFIGTVASFCDNATPQDLQQLIEGKQLIDKLMVLNRMVRTEIQVSKISKKLSVDFEKNVADNQRRMLLQEQLNLIKKELGLEKDDKSTLLDKFRKRLEPLTIPQYAQTVIDEEMEKLSTLEPHSSEFAGTRNYLDWLTTMPWGQYSKERFDIDKAEQILNEDHFGLQDVKDRIIEFIAVGKLCGAVPQGKILCLVGPPGVGKTSIGTSIARALGREFFRFSVGGLDDVAEIKGHRRTYIGAMPGKLIQCLKKVKALNPLVLIDEIDKIGTNSYRGDPASALLEVLDPKQNNNFVDHYLDLEIDLSKFLFICTANVRDTIPPALADRMDFVRISGYIASEKFEIADRFLVPEILKETGVKPDQVRIDSDALHTLIKGYCREAGVRNLQKYIQRIYRKAAVKIIRQKTDKIEICDSNLEDFVGKKKFRSERLYEQTPVGVVTGLAQTEMGGSTLYIETLLLGHNKDKYQASLKSLDKDDNTSPALVPLKVTGQLGKVMSESTSIAHSYAQRFLNKLSLSDDKDGNNSTLDSRFFEHRSIHIHVPEGATPKDGPSAGISMVTALLSLATNTPVLPDLAMTGEVTLTGQVLPIGGVKEKTIAARRSAIKTLIFPEGNRSDQDELSDEIKQGFQVHFVTTYDSIFSIAFPSIKHWIKDSTTSTVNLTKEFKGESKEL